MKNFLFLVSLIMLMVSCTPEPQEIEYGFDMCDFCKMSIVDQQHAAEVVTKKGKVFKFDAIECMLNFKKEKSTISLAYQLVNAFEKPKELQSAESSTYLISIKLPSPMGAYLTAFNDAAVAQKMLKEKGGKLFNWTELEEEFMNGGIKKYSLQ